MKNDELVKKAFSDGVRYGEQLSINAVMEAFSDYESSFEDSDDVEVLIERSGFYKAKQLISEVLGVEE